MGEKTSGKYTPRTIGSKPTRRDMPKDPDPTTEGVRETLKGNPFAKKYAGKGYGQ